MFLNCIVAINLYQFFLSDINLEIGATNNTATSLVQESHDETLENFSSEYHSLIKELLKKNIVFNKDSSFYLEDEYGGILAEATIGFHHKKIFIEPFDENSRETFVKNGYEEKTIDNLNLNDL